MVRDREVTTDPIIKWNSEQIISQIQLLSSFTRHETVGKKSQKVHAKAAEAEEK